MGSDQRAFLKVRRKRNAKRQSVAREVECDSRAQAHEVPVVPLVLGKRWQKVSLLLGSTNSTLQFTDACYSEVSLIRLVWIDLRPR